MRADSFRIEHLVDVSRKGLWNGETVGSSRESLRIAQKRLGTSLICVRMQRHHEEEESRFRVCFLPSIVLSIKRSKTKKTNLVAGDTDGNILL